MLAEYGVQVFETRTVYFQGSTVLRSGQPIFYLDDAGSGVNLPDALNADGTPVDKKTRIGNVTDVITATGAHMSMLAGTVADQSVGKTGPCFIDIIVAKQGDVLQVEVSNNAAITKNVTFLVAQNTADAPAFIAKATPVAVDAKVFLALQTVAINGGTPGTGDTRSVIWAICVKS